MSEAKPQDGSTVKGQPIKGWCKGPAEADPLEEFLKKRK